jgi:hypothetical protein
MASEDTTSTTAINKEEEPLFDPGLKKKKNKKLVDFDLEGEANGATASQPAEGEEPTPAGGDDMFDGMKKKSKKKKAIPMDLVSGRHCCQYMLFGADNDLMCSLVQDETSTSPAPDVAAADSSTAATDAAEGVPDGELDVSRRTHMAPESVSGPDSRFTLPVWGDEKEEEEGQKGRLRLGSL